MVPRMIMHSGEPTVRLYPGPKTNKHIIKFLGDWHGDPRLTAHIIRRSPDGVIKGLANLAYNLGQNKDVPLSPHQKKIFKKYKKGFLFLTDKGISIAQKRAVISGQQKGGALPALLPLLLPILAKVGLKLLGSAALGAAASGGAAIANKVVGGSE